MFPQKQNFGPKQQVRFTAAYSENLFPNFLIFLEKKIVPILVLVFAMIYWGIAALCYFDVYRTYQTLVMYYFDVYRTYLTIVLCYFDVYRTYQTLALCYFDVYRTYQTIVLILCNFDVYRTHQTIVLCYFDIYMSATEPIKNYCFWNCYLLLFLQKS